METLKRILIIIITISFFVFLLTIQGCRTVEYVPVHHHDTTYVAKIERDSVFVKDSTYVITRDDTVFLTKYIDRFRYIDRIDTIFKASNDTLYLNKVEYKEVEKKRPVRNGLALFGFISMLSLIGFILYKIKS